MARGRRTSDSRLLAIGVNAPHRDQRKGQVADLAEHAVQGSLVGDRPGEKSLARLVTADLQTLEPGRPVTVQDTVDADLVARKRLRLVPSHLDANSFRVARSARY